MKPIFCMGVPMATQEDIDRITEKLNNTLHEDYYVIVYESIDDYQFKVVGDEQQK